MSLAARRYTALSGVWRYAVGGGRSLGRLRLRDGTADHGAHVYAVGHVAHRLNGGGSLTYQSARVINRHWFHLELSHRDTGGDERIAEVAGDVFVM